MNKPLSGNVPLWIQYPTILKRTMTIEEVRYSIDIISTFRL